MASSSCCWAAGDDQGGKFPAGVPAWLIGQLGLFVQGSDQCGFIDQTLFEHQGAEFLFWMMFFLFLQRRLQLIGLDQSEVHQQIAEMKVAAVFDQHSRQVRGRYEAERHADFAQRNRGVFRPLCFDTARQLFVAEQSFTGQQFADFFRGRRLGVHISLSIRLATKLTPSGSEANAFIEVRQNRLPDCR